MPPLISREGALALGELTEPKDIETLVERAWQVRVARFAD
jgi:biotin synthase